MPLKATFLTKRTATDAKRKARNLVNYEDYRRIRDYLSKVERKLIQKKLDEVKKKNEQRIEEKTCLSG